MKPVKPLFLLLFFVVIAFMAFRTENLPKTKVVIGYVGGYKGLVDVSKIDVQKLTHINYAFVNVKNNRAFLNREATDTLNLQNLNKLKQINPNLKVLISIGGWAWSENFSDAAYSDTARKAFAHSAVAIIKKFNLDGVDVDWEYPALHGEEGNIFRPEDQQNFTLMLKELRSELNRVSANTKHKKLLTVAVGGFTNFIEHTEMEKAQQYLDYVNIMTYDFNNGELAGHHTNLYNSKKIPADNSADKAFKAYVSAGVPASKLVLGIAFYSRAYTLKPNSIKGLGDSVVSSRYGKGYTFIKDSLINQKGFKAYYDHEAKGAYIFNPTTREYMTYDDEKSVQAKCNYVKKNKMAGVMFWEYDADLNGYLLNQINNTLK